jgi:uncharacterized membrane protein YgcG
MGKRLVQLTIILSLFWGSLAEARRSVAVLRFGGRYGKATRGVVVRYLKRARFRVLSARAVPDACEALGIRLSKGANLARCAQKAGAVAVIGGIAKRRQLLLRIYSGEDGEVLANKKLRWRRRPSRRMRRRLYAILKAGLARAPRRVQSTDPDPPDPPPTRSGSGGGSGGGGSGDSGSGDSGSGDSDLTFDPDSISRSGGGGSTSTKLGPSTPDEDPLNKKKKAAAAKKSGDPSIKKKATPHIGPRVWATAGIGTWLRSFTVNEPTDNAWNSSYSSGLTFALRLAAWAKPLAFFLDNFAADFFVRLRFQATIGLSSTLQNSASNAQAFGTQMMAFIFDLGYDWNILGNDKSPVVDLSLGFGTQSFGIDWEGQTARLPDAGYTFLLIGAGARYQMPFLPLLGAHLRFDYRVVLGSSGLTDDASPGFGAASAGGLAFTVGANLKFGSIVGSVEYTYARYFMSFSDVQARHDHNLDPTNADKKPAAGGALDEGHTITLNAGYSF